MAHRNAFQGALFALVKLSKPSILALLAAGGFLLTIDQLADVSDVHAADPDDILMVPIRWCVIGDDANENGVWDPGEEGAPAFTDPADVVEPGVSPDTDNVLWRRHERTSDTTYIPMANLTFRSAIWDIAEADDLNFPIIPDKNPTDLDHEYGDVLDSRIDKTEWVDTLTECVNRWSSDEFKDVGNIGIVAVNARRIVDENGDRVFGGFAGGPDIGTSVPRFIVEDNAFRSPLTPLPGGPPFSDAPEFLVGHEAGHLLGMRHVCSTANGGQDGNLMYPFQGVDLDADGVIDNIDLSDGVTQVSDDGSDEADCTNDDDMDTVDQIATVRQTAEGMAGCKIFDPDEPDPDCSSMSDVLVDEVGDASGVFDITMLHITEFDDGQNEFAHELFDPFSNEVFEDFTDLEYFVLVDSDTDAATGGAPSDLGIPTEFQGAELVTRVRVHPIAIPKLLPDSPPSHVLAHLPTLQIFAADPTV
jgi:hypothetical protein